MSEIVVNPEMWAKLDADGYIVRPPTNAMDSEGHWITNCNRYRPWLETNGYEEHTQEWFDSHTVRPPVYGSVYTKRQIRHACQEMGIESKLNAILDGSETFYQNWIEQQDIDLNNEETRSALEQGTFTEAEIQAMIVLINSGELPNGIITESED